MYNFFNINHQADLGLRGLFLEPIFKIEQRDDIHFANKNSVHRELKKTGFSGEKRDKVSATPLILP